MFCYPGDSQESRQGHSILERLGHCLANRRKNDRSGRGREMMSCYPSDAHWSRQGHFLEGSASTSPTEE
jgi:hypothetical protein